MSHLAVVSNARVSTRRWIPLPLKAEVCSTPCVVCGVPYNLKCDHIVPVACGGGRERSNLQSLCHDCNHIKGRRLTNRAIHAEVARRGIAHFMRAVQLHDTRYQNKFDRWCVTTWAAKCPQRLEHAKALYAAFMGAAA